MCIYIYIAPRRHFKLFNPRPLHRTGQEETEKQAHDNFQETADALEPRHIELGRILHHHLKAKAANGLGCASVSLPCPCASTFKPRDGDTGRHSQGNQEKSPHHFPQGCFRPNSASQIAEDLEGYQGPSIIAHGICLNKPAHQQSPMCRCGMPLFICHALENCKTLTVHS